MMTPLKHSFLLILLMFFSNTRANTSSEAQPMQRLDTATFAAGCFWCIEEQFRHLEGVSEVYSGYTGGKTKNPTYKQVCSGSTGHAEACQIVYDPSVITFDELLAAFFVAHDPTQLNRQGNDVGTQYRSAIFYHNQKQKDLANHYIEKLNKERAYDKPIVTEVSSISTFYVAENYHQDYYENHSDEPYCKYVIQPKTEKFQKVFKGKLKH